jgi:hypothetical protein
MKTSYIIFFFYAAIAGVAAYNNQKLKKEVSRGSVSDPEQSVPLATSSASSK